MLPVKGGKWFDAMSVGKGLLDYDSFLALAHFKGHTQAVSADPTRISASAAQTAASAKP